LLYYFRHGSEGLALDNDDLFNNVLIDLYNEDIMHNLNWKSILKHLTADETTSSTSFISILNLSVPYTVSKPNVYARVTISQVQSGNAVNTYRILLSGAVGVDAIEVQARGTTIITLTIAGRWESVVAGAKTLDLQMKVSNGGTVGTIRANMDVLWEIWETD
jgi:hypothetical protein